MPDAEAARPRRGVLRLVRGALGRARRLARAWLGPPPAAPAKPVKPAAEPPLPIPAGHAGAGMPDGRGLRALIVLFASDEARIAAGVAEIARLQSMLPRFRPLFVSDAADTAIFERHGYACESLVPFDTWVATHGAEGWTDYVDGRMRSILETYRPERVVVLEAGPEFAALRRGLLNEVLAPE